VRRLVDECVRSAVVEELRKSGHGVVYAAEASPRARDRALAEEAAATDRILLTDDKDFGEIVFRDNQRRFGVVLFRISPARWNLRWPKLQQAIFDYGDTLCISYTVIEEARIRIQPLEPE